MLSKALPTGRAPEEVVSPETRLTTERASERRAHYRPGREGKSNVTGYFPPAVKKQLRLLAAQQETTIQALLAEALNDLFAKNGKPEIAPRDH
jgi:hypothetical protein